MTSPAHAIANYLNTQGIATPLVTTGWALSISNEPDSPPNVVTVYDTGGEEWDTDEVDMTTHAVQVRVRAVSYIDACAKVNEIVAALKQASFTYSGVVYLAIKPMGGMQHIGFDDLNRTLITLNLDCLVQEVS